jgi:hypothetical protein
LSNRTINTLRYGQSYTRSMAVCLATSQMSCCSFLPSLSILGTIAKGSTLEPALALGVIVPRKQHVYAILCDVGCSDEEIGF